MNFCQVHFKQIESHSGTRIQLWWFFFAKFGFLEIIPHVIHVCYFQIIDGKNHWYVCIAFFGPRRCGSLIWLSINGCCITCILNHNRCFFTVGIKAIGRDAIHRRKIYKCARCLRFNAHHVIGYHTSKRISFFINFW